MKFSKKQRSTVSFFILIVVYFIVVYLIKQHAPLQDYVILFYILFTVFLMLFGDDLRTKIISIISVAVIVSLFLFLIFWLFQLPFLNSIPLFKNGITNDFIIAFFTIILATSTVINLTVYKKSITISRLTILKANLPRNLYLNIKNIGGYPANQIKVSIDIKHTNPNKFKSLIKKETWLEFFEKIKLLFWVSTEADTQYLAPQDESEPIDICPLIKKHFRSFKVSYNSDNTRNISSEKEIKFNVIVIIDYVNDIGDKAPIPTYRKFKIMVNDAGVNVFP